MQVGAGRAPRTSNCANGHFHFDFGIDIDKSFAEVGITGCEVLGMLDFNDVAKV